MGAMKGRLVFLLATSLMLLGYGHGWCSGSAPRAISGVPGLPEFLNIHKPNGLPDVAGHRSRPRAAVPGDEMWRDGFGLPVTDGTVNAAIEYNGSLVVAGRFTRIGDVQANNIARWDGATWLPLGKGIEWGYVTSVAIHQGNLVVGGRFSFAGGVLARSIARWNGSDWLAIGNGFYDANTNPREVMSLGSDGETLVAALDLFYENYYGDPSAAPYPYRVDSWTGSDWVTLGTGANGPIRSFAFQGDMLFTGGAFDSIGSTPAAGVASWDGTSWSEVGGGVGVWGRSVDAMVVHSGRLVIGGGFDEAGGVSVGNVAAWNGSQWEALGTLPTQVAALAIKDDTIFAGCENALARWDGQSWVSAAPSLEGRPAALVPLGNTLFVVGHVEAANPGDATPAALSVAGLSNGSWHSLMTFHDQMHGLTGSGGQQATAGSMVPYRNHLVAAGSFRYGGAPPGWTRLSNLAEWTGTEWLPFPLPSGLDLVWFLEANGNTLYAAGTFQNQEGVPSSVFRYDGEQWTPLGNQQFVVWAMTLFENDLYVAAIDWRNDETSIRRWTGTAWEMVGHVEGSEHPVVDDLVVYDGSLVAAGRFTSIGGSSAANIATWNGATWQQLGPGLPSPSWNSGAIVRELVASKGRLFVSGDHLPGVMQWSGLAWEPLGELSGSVYTLADPGSGLFASGYFFRDAFEYYSLVRWSGTQWEELGSGTNGVVSSFAELDGSLYMGGWFSEAGGKPSFGIARWAGLQTLPIVPTLQAARPNPFSLTTTFSYTLPTSGSVRLSVHDVSGREIAVIDEGARSEGVHAVTWNGKDHSGRRVPSGVYFLRAALPSGVLESKKMILLR